MCYPCQPFQGNQCLRYPHWYGTEGMCARRPCESSCSNISPGLIILLHLLNNLRDGGGFGGENGNASWMLILLFILCGANGRE